MDGPLSSWRSKIVAGTGSSFHSYEKIEGQSPRLFTVSKIDAKTYYSKALSCTGLEDACFWIGSNKSLRCTVLHVLSIIHYIKNMRLIDIFFKILKTLQFIQKFSDLYM